MIDVLTLCNFCILGNALDFRTYGFANVRDTDSPSARDRDQRKSWDRNALSGVEREYFIYIRGLAKNLVRWLSCHYDVIPTQSQAPVSSFERDFCGKYLTDQACAILNYKKLAEKKLLTIPYFKFNDLECQMDYIFHADEEESFYDDWEQKKQKFSQYTSLALADRSYIVEKKVLPLKFIGAVILES